MEQVEIEFKLASTSCFGPRRECGREDAKRCPLLVEVHRGNA